MSNLKVENYLDIDVYVTNVEGATGRGKMCSAVNGTPKYVPMGKLTCDSIVIQREEGVEFPADCKACFSGSPFGLADDNLSITVDLGSIQAEDDKNVTIGQPQPC